MNIEWKITPFQELTNKELYALFVLRIEVFVVEQNCPYQDADGKDFKSLHLFAHDENEVICACARLVLPGVSYPEWSIGRVATSLDVRRQGIGRELMQRAMQYLREEKNNPPVRISAQTYLLEFYQSFGFVQVGDEYLEDDIPHIQMLFTP